MLTNDTVNLLTLCPALSLACQSCGHDASGLTVACVAIETALSLASLWLPHQVSPAPGPLYVTAQRDRLLACVDGQSGFSL